MGWGEVGVEKTPQIESNLEATSIFEDPHFGFNFCGLVFYHKLENNQTFNFCFLGEH